MRHTFNSKEHVLRELCFVHRRKNRLETLDIFVCVRWKYDLVVVVVYSHVIEDVTEYEAACAHDREIDEVSIRRLVPVIF